METITKPKLAIIGDGNVGSAIRDGARRAGYEVKTTGKDPPKVKELGAWADVVVLAVPYPERQNAVRELGSLRGKTLVDVTNALTPDYKYAGSVDVSGAEELQEMVSDANVVKAFNTVFAQNMSEGRASGERLSLLVAGDDDGAKRHVLELGGAIGFEPVDAGPLENARYLEALGFLNIQLGQGQKLGHDIGFKVVGARTKARRPEAEATSRAPRTS